jgi:hypothetical protein
MVGRGLAPGPGEHIDSEVTDGGERGALRGPRRDQSLEAKTSARTAAPRQFAADTAPLTVLLHSPPRTTPSRRKHTAGAERGKWRRQHASWVRCCGIPWASCSSRPSVDRRKKRSRLACLAGVTLAARWNGTEDIDVKPVAAARKHTSRENRVKSLSVCTGVGRA